MIKKRKEEDIKFITAYWVDWFINLNTIYNLQNMGKWVTEMEETMQRALAA